MYFLLLQTFGQVFCQMLEASIQPDQEFLMGEMGRKSEAEGRWGLQQRGVNADSLRFEKRQILSSISSFTFYSVSWI